MRKYSLIFAALLSPSSATSAVNSFSELNIISFLLFSSLSVSLWCNLLLPEILELQGYSVISAAQERHYGLQFILRLGGNAQGIALDR